MHRSRAFRFGLSATELDAACRVANGGRSVEVPTSVGFCMYIRRAALAEVGLFDADAFGRGYGEKTTSACVPARAAGITGLPATPSSIMRAR